MESGQQADQQLSIPNRRIKYPERFFAFQLRALQDVVRNKIRKKAGRVGGATSLFLGHYLISFRGVWLCPSLHQ
jgi:hypothetical protein